MNQIFVSIFFLDIYSNLKKHNPIKIYANIKKNRFI